MSGNVSIDLEEAKAFLSILQQFREVLEGEWGQVSNQWSNLESSWEDRQYDKIAPVYEKLSATYSEASQSYDNFIALLEGQIQIAEDAESRMGSLPDF